MILVKNSLILKSNSTVHFLLLVSFFHVALNNQLLAIHGTTNIYANWRYVGWLSAEEMWKKSLRLRQRFGNAIHRNVIVGCVITLKARTLLNAQFVVLI